MRKMRSDFWVFLLAIFVVTVVFSACAQKKGKVYIPGYVDGDPQAYEDANGITGGQLYDKFWASETGWSQSDPNLSIFSAKADFFRCKQCHGWDRLGTSGSYISRGPNANRPNVSSINLVSIAAAKTPQELFDALKSSSGRRAIDADLSTYDPATNSTLGDQMPDYASIFTEGQLWNLVKFLKEEAVDSTALYDAETTGEYPTGSIAYTNIGKNGNTANGDAIYASKCAGCHGADGRAFLFDGDSYTAGSFMRSKPHEAHQKIKFGQLGSPMGSLVTNLNDLKDLYKAMTDTVKYPDPS